MKKIRILFPYVEAGFGHIMTMKAVAEIFKEKYGNYCDIVETEFFKETKNKHMIDLENKLIKSVKQYNSCHAFGYFATVMCEFWGTTLSTFAAMRFISPLSFKPAMKYIESINPDVVFSTHWATNYYAKHLDSKPLSITYCPDATLNKLFKYPTDLTMISMETGYNSALSLKKYNKENMKLVPFAIRNEAFKIDNDKVSNRKKLGLPLNNFTIVLLDGGYGHGKMKELCEKMSLLDMHLTIIAFCGKNQKLYNKLNNIKVNKNICFKPMKFTPNVFEYYAASDLFLGKSGNAIAEPTFFNVPSIITGFSNFVERDIGNYYIKYVKCALKVTSVKKIIEIIIKFYNDPSLLEPLKNAAIMHHDKYGAEKIADEIWNQISLKFNLKMNTGEAK